VIFEQYILICNYLYISLKLSHSKTCFYTLGVNSTFLVIISKNCYFPSILVIIAVFMDKEY